VLSFNCSCLIVKKKGGITILDSGKRLLFWTFCLFLLTGCSDDISPRTVAKKVPGKEISSNIDTVKMNFFNKKNVILVEDESNFEFKDLELENAGVIIFQPIRLKKAETLTLTFKIQSNDFNNHVNVGVIKNYSPDSRKNYDIQSIYSNSIGDELITVNYTSQEDFTYGICILGTMAATIKLNGNITKN
jgi:hypothetical protein